MPWLNDNPPHDEDYKAVARVVTANVSGVVHTFTGDVQRTHDGAFVTVTVFVSERDAFAHYRQPA